VLVRCFVDKKGTENQIAEKLGVGFSRPPFATVVVCSLLCMPSNCIINIFRCYYDFISDMVFVDNTNIEQFIN
jgi:hypothetical protein